MPVCSAASSLLGQVVFQVLRLSKAVSPGSADRGKVLAAVASSGQGRAVLADICHRFWVCPPVAPPHRPGSST